MLENSARSAGSLLVVLLAWTLVLGTLALAGPASAQQRVTIEGTVWADRNGDGVRGDDEPALEGVRVFLSREDTRLAETVTNANGRYRFRRLQRGLHKVRIDDTTLPDNLGLGPASFWERNFADVGTTTADFGFVPRRVIEQLAAQEEERRRTEKETDQGDASAPDPIGTATNQPRTEGEGLSKGEPDSGRADPPGGADRPADRDRRAPAPSARSVPRAVWIAAAIAALLAGWLVARSRSSRAPATLETFLAHRDAQAWARMEATYRRLPEPVSETSLVRQQRAFGLNRAGEWREAERILRDELSRQGPSPETCGILGRVYKDRWEEARRAGDEARAAELLDQAVERYLEGHESDPKNPYPGINALTLMEWYPPSPERREGLLAEVRATVAARPASDYWDHATALELAILIGDRDGAERELAAALRVPKIRWQVESTCRNLQILREGREEKGEPVPDWARECEEKLRRDSA